MRLTGRFTKLSRQAFEPRCRRGHAYARRSGELDAHARPGEHGIGAKSRAKIAAERAASAGPSGDPVQAMKELLRTNNVVRLSWAQALLADAGIDSIVLDHHTSLVEGSIGAIPRRLMVAERDHRRAGALIAEAEGELR
jgi:hypothetical protein